MTITNIVIKKVQSNNGHLKAIVSVTLDDCFVLHELKVVEGEKGLFVAMPSKQLSDKTFRDIAHPINAQTRKMFEEAIIAKYQEEC
jgi:putative septation protein spoVG